MSFGWSAGDIATAIRLLVEVVQVLDTVHGAAKSYREGTQFLKRLIHVLEPLQTFTNIGANPTFRDEICMEVDAIKTQVEEFLTIVMKYERGLGRGREGHYRNVGRKLQWHYSDSKKLEKLEMKIGHHMQALDILLQRLTIDMISSTQKSLPERLRATFTEVLDERLRSIFQDDLKPLETNVLALREELSQSHQALIGYLEKNMLVSSALDTILETIMNSKMKGMAEVLESPKVVAIFDTPHSAESERIYTAAQLRSEVSRLVVQSLYIPDAACIYYANQFRPDRRVNTKLQRWWAASRSSSLWIQEQVDARSPSLINIGVLIAAQRAKTQVIRFCCADECGSKACVSTPLELLIKLVHSFIYQLAHQLQFTYTSDGSITLSRFDSLNQSVDTLPLALHLLRDLISVDSTPLIFEIDWFHVLEDRCNASSTTYLKELLGILRSSDNASSRQCRVMKLLITTPGQSLVLLEYFKFYERVDALDSTEKHYCSIMTSLAQIQPHGTAITGETFVSNDIGF